VIGLRVRRNGADQAMFVVTPAGVIATDPISYGRPQAAKTYVEEIQKITKAPIKYLIYSHHLSAEVKKASDAGKCFDPAVKDVRLPQYATLLGYEANIEWNIHRWCGYWGRGI
jgi:hypothetical protein